MKSRIHVGWKGLLAIVLSFAAQLAWATDRVADDFLLKSEVVPHGPAANQVRVYGKEAGHGEYVVILPSLGRGVEDYTEQYHSTLVTRLVEAGYRVALIQPRGIGKSSGDLSPQKASMRMFVGDVKAVLDALGVKRANFIGHGFGNRLARTYATLYPDDVDHLVLMASGGKVKMNAEQKACLANSFKLELPDEQRLRSVKCAFFAKKNDPSVWLTGWYPALARAQVHASKAIDGEFFEKAGGKPFLLLQAEEDFIAPPDKSGRVLKAELGDQVTYVEIPDAGHALSSEQPDSIASHIIDYFAK